MSSSNFANSYLGSIWLKLKLAAGIVNSHLLYHLQMQRGKEEEEEEEENDDENIPKEVYY